MNIYMSVGWIGLGWGNDGLGWVGLRKLDPWPWLVWPASSDKNRQWVVRSANLATTTLLFFFLTVYVVLY